MLPDSTTPTPWLTASRAAGGLVERGRAATRRAAADAGAIVGADEAGAFERELQHRLQRAVQRRVAGGVVRSLIRIETGSCSTARRRPLRRPVGEPDQPGDEHRGRRRHLPGEAAHQRQRHALGVELAELGEQVLRRREPLGRIGLDAARDQVVERRRNRRVDGPGGGGDSCIRRCSSAMALSVFWARMRPSSRS